VINKAFLPANVLYSAGVYSWWKVTTLRHQTRSMSKANRKRLNSIQSQLYLVFILC